MLLNKMTMDYFLQISEILEVQGKTFEDLLNMLKNNPTLAQPSVSAKRISNRDQQIVEEYNKRKESYQGKRYNANAFYQDIKDDERFGWSRSCVYRALQSAGIA